ncbi:hypothetical protein ACFL49_00080 [Candidatus Omnitrophota bacterium]
MKKNLVARLMVFLIVICCGCQVYSMVVLENPEFPDSLLPTKLSDNLQNKYSLGEVTVHPRINYADSDQKTFKLFIVFFSKTNSPVVSIKALTVSVNGKKLEYGKEIIGKSGSAWKLYPANKPFYASHISGAAINLSKKEMVESKVNLSLNVSVKKDNGKVVEKKIEAYFLSKKKSYIE